MPEYYFKQQHGTIFYSSQMFYIILSFFSPLTVIKISHQTPKGKLTWKHRPSVCFHIFAKHKVSHRYTKLTNWLDELPGDAKRKGWPVGRQHLFGLNCVCVHWVQCIKGLKTHQMISWAVCRLQLQAQSSPHFGSFLTGNPKRRQRLTDDCVSAKINA